MESCFTYEIKLTASEIELLLKTLEIRVFEFRMELARTDRPQFQHELHHELDEVEQMQKYFESIFIQTPTQKAA